MCQTIVRLTVFFQDPFWVGIFERTCENYYEVCKMTFGSEPKDYEVYAFLLEGWRGLHFSTPVNTTPPGAKRINPKRMQRSIKRQLQETGAGTKAQQALKLQQEQNKMVRKSLARENREAEQQRKFSMKQQKRKEKHRGH
ncbi:YjdF family protein [Oscillospiraceae bacterium LTW-04]|nr:YjdF family protein [Oscillospiraceae bacterium MB24-C1]